MGTLQTEHTWVERNKELIVKAQAGDEEALNELVEGNMGLVWKIVHQYPQFSIDKEDLAQEGALGLVRAIQIYDTTKYDTTLSTLAFPYIRGNIQRYLRDVGRIGQAKVPRDVRMYAKKIVEGDLKGLSVSELTKQLEAPKESTIVMALSYLESSYGSWKSMDAPMLNTEADSRLTFGDLIEGDSNGEWEDKLAVKDLVQQLSDRHRAVIEYQYYLGLTQGEVAKLLGVSQAQVSRIRKQAEENLRLMLVS